MKSFKRVIVVAWLSVFVLIATAPVVLASDPGQQLRNIDWLGIVTSFLDFLSAILEKAAKGVSQGSELLQDMFN